MSERANGDPKICEIRVNKVEKKDLGDWRSNLFYMCHLLQFGNISRCVVRSKDNHLKGRILKVVETPQETDNGRKCHACRITINHCTMIKLKKRLQSIGVPKN